MIKLMCFDDNTGEEIKEGNIFNISFTSINMNGIVHADCDDLNEMVAELTFGRESMLQIIKAIRQFGGLDASKNESVEESAAMEAVDEVNDESEEETAEPPVPLCYEAEEKVEKKGRFPLDWGRLLSLVGAGLDVDMISREMGITANALRNAIWRFKNGQVDSLLESKGIDKECIEQAKKVCGIN